jgi:hypothetical protein
MNIGGIDDNQIDIVAKLVINIVVIMIVDFMHC